MTEKIVIETPRLLVRKISLEDVDALQKILDDREVMRFSLTGPLDKAGIENYIKATLHHYDIFGYGIWTLISKENGLLIGVAGLIHQTSDDLDCTELVYRLATDYWGRGLATEAALAIKQYSFTTLDLYRLVSIIQPENFRSKKVAENVGMSLWKRTRFKEHDVEIYDVNRLLIYSYDPSWKKMYENEVQKLKEVFRGHLISFHHIGSTSIPSCDAKPIIDILAVTNDILQIDQFNSSLEKIDYMPLGEYGIRQRRFFRKRNYLGEANLHVFEDSDPEVARHLGFRNYLRAHPEKVVEYSQLKQRLAKENTADRTKYTLSKSSFIKSIDYLALQENDSYWHKADYPRKSSWSRSEILHAMEVNMQLHMTYFAKYMPQMQIIYEPDVIVVQSSIRNDTFNYVINALFSKNNVKDRIRHVLQLFQAENIPFSWVVGESDTPEALEQALVEQGLSPKEDNLGMYLLLDDVQFGRNIANLSIRRVLDQATLKDFANVMTSLIDLPDIYDQFFSKIPQVLYGEDAPFEMYVGYLNHVPVVTGILVLHANCGGIYYVMTHPDYRRKGYGTDMMVSILMRVKERGYHLAVLQASASGRHLYQRLGFQPICKFVEYG